MWLSHTCHPTRSKRQSRRKWGEESATTRKFLRPFEAKPEKAERDASQVRRIRQTDQSITARRHHPRCPRQMRRAQPPDRLFFTRGHNLKPNATRLWLTAPLSNSPPSARTASCRSDLLAHGERNYQKDPRAVKGETYDSRTRRRTYSHRRSANMRHPHS